MRPFYDPLHNFISPVTGRIIIDPNYVLIGDKNGMSLSSPILIDIRLDLIDLRRDFNYLLTTNFVINFPNEQLPNAQVLSELENGFMYNTEGIISTTSVIPITSLPDLTHKYIWIGDQNNRPVEQPIITIDNLPNLGVGTVNIPNPFNPDNPIVLSRGKIWRGTDSTRPEESDSVTALEADVLLLTARFLTSAWILRNSGLIPNALRPIFWPNTQFLDELSTNSLLIHTTNGTIGVATLTQNKIWTGDVNNKPIETLALIIDNLPNLGISTNPLYVNKGKIWRGTATNRPIESDDLSALEVEVDIIKNVTIPAIQADITAIQGQITAIQGQILIIQGQILIIQGQISAIQLHLISIDSAILIIQGQISSIFSTLNDYGNRISTLESQFLLIQASIILINQRIDNLRLNNIPVDGDVSFYNYKLINLADPVNQTDGVNLRTLISYINNVPTNINLIGDVTGSGNTGTPIVTTLQLTLDQIRIAQDTVNLNNQKISNLKSDEVEQQDAINAKFLWDLMHDQVGVVWQ